MVLLLSDDWEINPEIKILNKSIKTVLIQGKFIESHNEVKPSVDTVQQVNALLSFQYLYN